MWDEGQCDAPTKTKTLSFEFAASYSAEIIHKFTSNFCLWLRHWVSQVRFTHSHVVQADILECTELNTHTHTHTHTQFNKSHRTKRERNGHLDFFPDCCWGFRVRAGVIVLITDILTEPHQLDHQTDSSTDFSCTVLRHRIQGTRWTVSQPCTHRLWDYHIERWI